MSEDIEGGHPGVIHRNNGLLYNFVMQLNQGLDKINPTLPYPSWRGEDIEGGHSGG